MALIKVQLGSLARGFAYCDSELLPSESLELAAVVKTCQLIGARPKWDVLDVGCGFGWNSVVIDQLVGPGTHEAWDSKLVNVMTTEMGVPDIRTVHDDVHKLLKQAPAVTWDWAFVNVDDVGPDLIPSLLFPWVRVTIRDTSMGRNKPFDWCCQFGEIVNSIDDNWCRVYSVVAGGVAFHTFSHTTTPPPARTFAVTKPIVISPTFDED